MVRIAQQTDLGKEHGSLGRDIRNGFVLMHTNFTLSFTSNLFLSVL